MKELKETCREAWAANNRGFCCDKLFMRDYRRASLVNRYCKKYIATGDIAHKVIINNIVAMRNVFGNAVTRRLVLAHATPQTHLIIASFLKFLQVSSEQTTCDNMDEMLADMQRNMS